MRQESSPKAVVLLSGGVDSTTCLAVAKKEGFDLYALSFFYHQRHGVEIEAARRVATAFRVKEHLVLDLPLNRIGGSALTDAIEVPKDTPGAAMEAGIPVTYVPARNTIFLSLALGWAEVLGAADLFIGVSAVDYSGYPDCRPEFIRAFEAMANLALKATVEQRMTMRIHTPLMHLSKARIIRYGAELGVDYSLTHSCYDPDPRGRACGRCDSCVLRSRGFREAGIPDPAAAG